MRAPILAVASLMLVTNVAEAGWNEDQFAHFAMVEPGQIDAVEGYQLRGVRDFTHALVGRYRDGEHYFHALVLLRCDRKKCHGERTSLPTGDQLDFHGVIDLAGKPGPLRGDRVDRHRARRNLVTLGAKRLRVPALVFEGHRRTERRDVQGRWGKVSGTERRSQLVVIALTARDGKLARRVFQGETVSRGASGAGTSTSYRLDKGKHHGVRDIVATEQRHLDNNSRCKRPDPIEYRLIIKGTSYARAGDFAFSRGC